MVRPLIRSAPLAGAILFPCLAAAASAADLPGPETLTLERRLDERSPDDSQANAEANQRREAPAEDRADRPLYLADTAEEKPNIHGFFSSPFKTSYVTPRGLVVENSGVVWQPVVGLIFPLGNPFGEDSAVKNLAVIAGIWNSVNSAQGDPQVGPWNEMDVFVSLSADVAEKFNLTLTYGAWNFPQSTPNKPSTEHNLDLKIVYNDSDLFGGGFPLKPYVDIFYAISGSSTVVLGREGNTGYLEIGVSPTFTYKGVADSPMTITIPAYTSVGPADYWDVTESSGNW